MGDVWIEPIPLKVLEATERANDRLYSASPKSVRPQPTGNIESGPNATRRSIFSNASQSSIERYGQSSSRSLQPTAVAARVRQDDLRNTAKRSRLSVVLHQSAVGTQRLPRSVFRDTEIRHSLPESLHICAPATSTMNCRRISSERMWRGRAPARCRRRPAQQVFAPAARAGIESRRHRGAARSLSASFCRSAGVRPSPFATPAGNGNPKPRFASRAKTGLG